MMTHSTEEWEQGEDQFHMKNMDTTTQELGHALREEEEETHQEDIVMSTGTIQEIGTGTEDTLIGAAVEKEEEILRKTGIGSPAMATKGDTERVARSP